MTLPPQDYFDDPDYQRLESAFHDYVAQGDGRNISWLVAKTGLPLATVAKGMVKGMWPQRIQGIGRDAAVVVQAKLVGDVAEMNKQDVARLMEMEDLAWDALTRAIKEDRVKPDTLWRIAEGAQARRREHLGLGEGGGGSLADRLGKILEASLTGNDEAPAKPFVLDRKLLQAPPDLPAAPGMTSDHVDQKRELEDNEKESLRG